MTNTLLIQAADALAGHHRRNAVETFFDFSQLIETTILHERLYTLEGQIWPEFQKLQWLMSFLEENEILQTVRVPLDLRGTQQNLIRIVGAGPLFEGSNRLADWIPEFFPDDAPDDAEPFPDDRGAFSGALYDPRNSGALASSDSIFSFLRSLLHLRYFLFGTGEAPRGAYILRTYGYTHAAWKNRIVFAPDYPRIPFVRSTSDREYESVVTEGYELLLDHLGGDVERFLKDQRPVTFPIPPFTAILLNRCEDASQALPRLLELREEYSHLRKTLSDFERVRLESTDFREREEAQKIIARTFQATARSFRKKKSARFSAAVDFAADAANIAGDPMNPSSYKSSLILKPFELFRDWWLRRPLTQLFEVAEEFRNIDEYASLAQRTLGLSFSKNDLSSFDDAQSLLARLFHRREE